MQHESQTVLDSAREAMKGMKSNQSPSPVDIASAQAIGFGARFARAVRELPLEHQASALAFVRDFIAEGESSVSAMGYKSVAGEK